MRERVSRQVDKTKGQRVLKQNYRQQRGNIRYVLEMTGSASYCSRAECTNLSRFSSHLLAAMTLGMHIWRGQRSTFANSCRAEAVAGHTSNTWCSLSTVCMVHLRHNRRAKSAWPNMLWTGKHCDIPAMINAQLRMTCVQVHDTKATMGAGPNH